MVSSTNGDADTALEQSRREKKEASMKRLIKVVEPEKEVRIRHSNEIHRATDHHCQAYLVGDSLVNNQV